MTSVTPMLRKTKTIQINGNDVLVKDPSLKNVLAILPEVQKFLPKLGVFSGMTDSASAVEAMLPLLADAEFFTFATICASACTDRPSSLFEDISITETMEVIDAVIEVVDFANLKSLFFQISQKFRPKT